MGQRTRSIHGKGPLGLEDRARALDLVRGSVEAFVRTGHRLRAPSDSSLAHRRASLFVTLTIRGNLRGCIGILNPLEPLHHTLVRCAIAAASEDHRFPPISEADLPEVHYEISLLSRFRQARSPEDVDVGRHGLLLQARGREGLLLPRVAQDHGWGREEFLEQVSRKAGLPPEAWRWSDCRLSIFSAEVFGTEDV
jgi:AmmeMemoRadiSam system protein A